MAVSDEKLMAYADGELSAAEAAEIERAIADDEALAGKVAMFADSRKAMKKVYGSAPAVPDALAAKIRAMAEADTVWRAEAVPAGDIVELASRRRSAPVWQLPAAAAIALAVGVAAGWFMKPDGQPGGGLEVAGLSDPAIIDALGSVASGQRVDLGGGAEFAAIATFRDGDGQLCREFERDREGGPTVVAIACRSEATWDVRFAVAAAAPDSASYAPASSLDTLEAYLSATGAGAPLSEPDERAALDALR